MRKSAIATTTLLFVSVVAIIADMTQQGYMTFTSASDIKKALPNITPLEFAKVIEGNSEGCLTKPSQTKPVTVAQIRTLRQLTKPDEIATLLGNPFCATKDGTRWILESGKTLNLKANQVLDYDFSTNTPQSLTNTQKRSPEKANGSANRTLPSRVSAPNPLKDGRKASPK